MSVEYVLIRVCLNKPGDVVGGRYIEELKSPSWMHITHKLRNHVERWLRT